MAVSTLTASSQTATPRVLHTGVITAFGTFTLNAAASTTLSDVRLMVKIPDRAWIVNGYVTGTNGGVGALYKVGTQQDDDCCTTATSSLSVTAVRSLFNSTQLPFQVSLSDDVEPKYTWLTVTAVSGSSTLTESLKVFVEYVMPGGMTGV
jgi:hypothetical protein